MAIHDNILREITPLTQSDCFTYFYRTKSEFDFPLHYHDEIELNFIRNAKGAKRIIGDHVEEIGNLELALVGPELPHGWFGTGFAPNQVEEVTIQFHKDFFDEKFLQKNQLNFIRDMLRRSLRGIVFSTETTARLEPRIVSLGKRQGFDSVLELLSILHDLSISRDYRLCSDSGFSDTEVFNYNSRRIEKVMEFIHSSFERQITLGEAARIASMTESAFSRFFKLRTGMTFIDCVTEIRLGHASRMLISTTKTISEIAYSCGFNNISNFNRTFRRKKGCTPRELRESYDVGMRVFI
ncbi:MAG TPA: AraC family transcriptional regulator [Bacteroidales bacterium]|jgi:AraC-like DNA-binding protein|nr:helix-turn-helix domain-containing protein [Bacteroidales bacterium]MDI9533010.1 AraC family transcriptional regulator [Bacteroidota bacterium]OPZ57517.1 MAG: HTH-type transcriptional regulator YesS [Bacteroidetes bacterium ADurb.BinA012]MBK7732210.1 helix-turn-helix domain-containing protein [Bacteroidales bacterium]MBP7036481.1 helix-turn-helix domain-containing protein [Bacteroidales bacterium]